MAQFETISHGEPMWEGKVNKNFSNVVQDSGWQSLPVLAPATGSIKIRVLNSVLYFIDTITPNASGNVEVATFPSTIASTIPAVDLWSNNNVTCVINKGKMTLKGVPESSVDHPFSLDAVSLLVGIGQNLPGGGRIPLAQRFGDLLNYLFNTKLEVA